MSAITFDTLKRAHRLEAAEFSTKQAGDTAEALADSLSDLSEGVTKSDVKSELKRLGQRLLLLEQRMTIKLGGLIIAAAGILLAGMRYITAAH